MNRNITLLTMALFSIQALAMDAPRSPSPERQRIRTGSPIAERRRIRTVTPRDGVLLDKQGYFKLDDENGNSNSAKIFLERAAENGKAPESLKNIKTARSGANRTAVYANEQLFLVEAANGNKYILKEIKHTMKPQEEIKRLDRAFYSLRLQPYVYPKEKNNLTITLPRAYLKYNDGKREHTLVLMQKAAGETVQSVMQKFQANPNQEVIDLVCRTYYDLGRAMARFYQEYGSLDKTVIHGDFHAGNIFYDKQSGLVTLIDNERIARSLEDGRRPIDNDMGHLLILSPCIVEYGIPGFLKKMDIQRWYQIALPSFIFGFVRAYPYEERLAVFNRLKAAILAWEVDERATKTASKYGIDQSINNVLNRLEQQLMGEEKTELHIAAGNCDLTKLVEIMLAEGTKSINEADNDGNIPLHEAAYFGCKRSAKLLVRAGSKINAQNVKGETPLFKAQYNRRKELETLLEKKGAR